MPLYNVKLWWPNKYDGYRPFRHDEESVEAKGLFEAKLKAFREIYGLNDKVVILRGANELCFLLFFEATRQHWLVVAKSKAQLWAYLNKAGLYPSWIRPVTARKVSEATAA